MISIKSSNNSAKFYAVYKIGQIYEIQGNKDEAYNFYKEALRMPYNMNVFGVEEFGAVPLKEEIKLKMSEIDKTKDNQSNNLEGK
jgi:hypothetical protein